MELQHYMMKFVSDLWQVAGFFLALRFPPPSIKLNPHDVTEILLKVTLNTIYLALITLFAWFTIPSRTVSIQRKSYSPQVCASSSSGKFSEKKVFMKKKKAICQRINRDCVYDAKYTILCDWCRGREIHPVQVSVRQLADFSVYHFEIK